MSVTALDKLLACKAISLMHGLSVIERRVAVALIDHFRTDDSRCDPGFDRLAEELGIDRRSVMRAVNTLHRDDLIHRDRYGGRHRANSYAPNWPRLREEAAFWQQRLSRRGSSGATRAGRAPGQDRAAGDDIAVAQTSSQIPLKDPVGPAAASRPPPICCGNRRKGQAGQGLAAKPVVSPSHREAAEQSAIRRWDADLRKHYADDTERFETIIAAIDENRARLITNAEMHRRGDGLNWILQHAEELGMIPEGGSDD